MRQESATSAKNNAKQSAAPEKLLFPLQPTVAESVLNARRVAEQFRSFVARD